MVHDRQFVFFVVATTERHPYPRHVLLGGPAAPDPYHCGSMLRVNCGLRGVDRTLGSLSLVQWRVLSLATREETSLHRCTLIRSLSIFVLSRASFSFWEPFLHRIAFDFDCFGMLVVCPSSHGLAQVAILVL